MLRNRFLVAACAVALASFVPAHAGNKGNGAAAGTNAANASGTLERCGKPYGTIAVVEDTGGDWYQYLTTDLRLGSTVPLLRLMAQQSNCFVVVERGRAMGNMMGERQLEESGELREGSNFHKGQMARPTTRSTRRSSSRRAMPAASAVSSAPSAARPRARAR